MRCIATPLPGLQLLEPAVYGDERGFFLESWNVQVFRSLGIDANFVQDNHSSSRQGILRGLHYQIEHTQGKLVRAVRGSIYDVVVDLRQSSPNFGQWYGVELSAANKYLLWVPPGFAHGFYVTSEAAEMVYKCDDYYAPEHEVTLAWDDPTLAIDWPLLEGVEVQLSAKDREGLSFGDAPKIA